VFISQTSLVATVRLYIVDLLIDAFFVLMRNWQILNHKAGSLHKEVLKKMVRKIVAAKVAKNRRDEKEDQQSQKQNK
jgi:hypothetical protein